MALVSGPARQQKPRTAVRRIGRAARLSLTLVLPLSIAPAPAEAVTTSTGNFTVTMTVAAACTVSATPLAFGVYKGVRLDGTATVTVTCTNTTPWYVNMGNGSHQDGSFYPRMIGPGGAFLSYHLYQDAPHGVPWRNTYNLDGEAGTGTGATQALTVYGEVLTNQNVASGAYSDTVIVTLTY